jgi:hypothetical protein
MKTAIKHNNFKVGNKIILPNNIYITAIGLKTIPYKLVSYTVDLLYSENGHERIILKRRKKLHDKYINTVQEILTEINRN